MRLLEQAQDRIEENLSFLNRYSTFHFLTSFLQQILIMDFIPLLKAKKNALRDCKDTTLLSQVKRQKLKENLQILQYAPWVTKGVLLLGIVFGVNWKKQVPITRRQLPLAVGAVALSALSDYLVLDFVWKQHSADIIKLTGFKNGIYVNPERMISMRNKMGRRVVDVEQDLTIQDD